MPLAGTTPFYKAPSEHNQRATARARSTLACCASSPDTESAGTSALSDTRRWLGDGGRSWRISPRPHAEGEMPLAGAALFYEAFSEDYQRATARALSKLACCASTPETESAGALALSETRRWLGAGGRSWLVAPRPHVEGEMPLAGTAPFYEVSSEHNKRATARLRA